MTCPKCGHAQPESDECARCGLVFRKLHARPLAAAVVPEPPIEPAPRSRSLAPLLIAAMFGAAIFGYARQREPKATSLSARARPARSTSVAAQEGSLLETPRSAWYEGASGYAEAEREHRLRGTSMVVYFYTDWCGYCKRMDSGILSTTEASVFLDRTLKVKVNPEQGSAEQALASSYGVRGYPSFFVVSAKGPPSRVHPFQRDASGQWIEMTPGEFVAECRQRL